MLIYREIMELQMTVASVHHPAHEVLDIKFPRHLMMFESVCFAFRGNRFEKLTNSQKAAVASVLSASVSNKDWRLSICLAKC